MIYASIKNRKDEILVGDIEIVNDSEFGNVENIANECSEACCIEWHRASDGQKAYYGPGGVRFGPYWYNHGNAGNQNASKDETLDSHLHIRVSSADKARWVKLAQSECMKLQPWVIKKLNEVKQ